MNRLEQQLKVNEVYYIHTSHEDGRPYIYEGIQEKVCSFFREGAINKDESMRRIFVNQSMIMIEGSTHLHIVNDSYSLDVVSKESKLEEYTKLKKLWESKQK